MPLCHLSFSGHGQWKGGCYEEQNKKITRIEVRWRILINIHYWMSANVTWEAICSYQNSLQTSKSSKTRQNKLGVLISTWISNKPLWSYTRKLLNLIDESFPNCSVAYCMWLQRTLDGLRWERESIAENATTEAFLFKHLYSALF